jgi:hypothetical protein
MPNNHSEKVIIFINGLITIIGIAYILTLIFKLLTTLKT